MSTFVDQTKLLVHSILWRTGIQASRISPYTNDGVALTAMLNHARVDLLLDVGANVGQYAKERIASGYSGRIVSFEPLSEPRAVLLKEASVRANWQVADQCAIGENKGTVKMRISENSLASSILPLTNTHLNYSPRAVEVATEIVRLARLDEVAQPYLITSQSPFLKIDVQGFEDQVIAGSTRILPKLVGL
jgi:FkbM family methyltransferase